jgi:hypothetical protein
MSETVEQRDEAIPAEPSPFDPAPIETPTPADNLDALLNEYASAVKGDADKPLIDAEPPPAADAQDDPVAAILRDMDTNGKRVAELESELTGVRAEMHRKAEIEAFDKFSSKLQAECGPNVPEDYARTQLLAMAAQDQNLQAAWHYRNLTDADRRAADLALKQLEDLYQRAQQAPNDPRKAAALAALERRGWELGFALNARAILNKAWRDVAHRARAVKPPIDADATADRNAVAAAVRDAHGKVEPSRPPDLSNASNKELNDYTKQFDFRAI